MRNNEALVYDLSTQELMPSDFEYMVSEAIYKNKAHLGPRGMIECALVLAREFARQMDSQAKINNQPESQTDAGWQEFSGTTPIDKPLLLWFVGRNAPKAAHACAIGSISSHQPGMVWTDGDYRPVEWFSHWQHLPTGP